MEFTQSNCRICLKSDASFYVSIEDEVLDEKITDLIQEISQKKILVAEGLSKLICKTCCKSLAAAIRTRRLFLCNDEALLHCFQYSDTVIQTSNDDPFLAEFDLEFNDDPEEGSVGEAPPTDEDHFDDDDDLLMEVEELDDTMVKVESDYEVQEDTKSDIAEIEVEKLDTSYVDEEEIVSSPKKPKSKRGKQAPNVDKASVLAIRPEELKLTCCMCKFSATTESDLIAHLYTHPERARRSAFQKKIKEAAPDQKKTAVGKLCIKCLRRVPDLEYHLKYYYVKLKFQCSQCGDCFGFYPQMKQHEQKCIRSAKIKVGLMDEERFECHICSKRLKTKSILDSHISIHMRTEADRVKFKCHICQRGYPTMRSLRSHVLLHTDVAIFQCPMCEKAFKKRTNLDSHIRVHNNDRCFKCNYCEKTYIHSTDRKRHEMAVHTGERPFKCQLCNDGFVKRHSLNIHMKKVHLVDTKTVDYVIIKEEDRVAE